MMKIPTLLFILIIIAALAIGIAVQYYGRTCPGCLKRKQAIMDAINGKNNGNNGVSAPTMADLPTTFTAKVPMVFPPVT